MYMKMSSKQREELTIRSWELNHVFVPPPHVTTFFPLS